MQIELFMRHPLRSLLYIEWILFAVVMAIEVSPRDGQMLELKWLHVGIVAVLALMGLRLPAGKLLVRVLFTIAQTIVIFLAAYVGMRQVGLLCVIVLMRSYLVFGRQYRLWVTGGIFALYLIATTLFPYRQRSRAFRGLPPRTNITNGNSRPQPSPGASAPPVDRQGESAQETRRERDGFKWGFVSLFAGILLSLQLLVDRILAEKQAKEELAIANQRIRTYALRAQENGSLQERNRIAREIHDSLGHSLTALNLHLEMAVKLSQIQPEKSREVLLEAKRLGSIALKDVRESVSTLRSDPLHNQDLTTAIYKLADEFKLSNQIRPACYLDLPPNLPQPIAITIYRIIQEALTNISKYARATEVIVEIRTEPTTIELNIIDNGRGFIPDNNMCGFGIQGMRERVLSLQGEFEIISDTDSGCQIIASIPFVKE
ncbi:sensor histidine kinase [Chamaesiphon polymorphus]|uniref:histidine kinase n=1 Tax=Chamaesiphon polymorphus CCALA 037 TaxID=2107692 RepID=A0A2T1GLQ4_9CYAN|nr:sensor histidine kinase [Chamaesiphon polymorphus]PSB58728.1 sensor histidine kinase [Chamaesiphon polymorphus CCALA 037]